MKKIGNIRRIFKLIRKVNITNKERRYAESLEYLTKDLLLKARTLAPGYPEEAYQFIDLMMQLTSRHERLKIITLIPIYEETIFDIQDKYMTERIKNALIPDDGLYYDDFFEFEGFDFDDFYKEEIMYEELLAASRFLPEILEQLHSKEFGRVFRKYLRQKYSWFIMDGLVPPLVQNAVNWWENELILNLNNHFLNSISLKIFKNELINEIIHLLNVDPMPELIIGEFTSGPIRRAAKKAGIPIQLFRNTSAMQFQGNNCYVISEKLPTNKFID